MSPDGAEGHHLVMAGERSGKIFEVIGLHGEGHGPVSLYQFRFGAWQYFEHGPADYVRRL